MRPCPVPADSLLARHCAGIEGAYTDNFMIELPRIIALPEFVEAFYSSWAFKPELFSVGLLFRKPWAGDRARRLAMGEIEDFSAWRAHGRTSTELLLREIISDRTRSWLKAETLPDGATRLFFGSAVLPAGVKANGEPRMSVPFSLVPFHRWYARLLLASAGGRLRRIGG